MARYYEKKIGLNNCEIHIYESLDDCVSTVHPGLDQFSDWKSSYFLGRDFHYEKDVVDASSSYWDEGMEIVDRMLTELSASKLPKPASRKRKPRWNEETGDEICLDRLRSGQSFWREARRELVKGQQTVTIIADFGANSGIAAKDILWRGAAAVTLTYLLEEAGYRIELWGAEYASHVYRDGTGCIPAICLKRPQDPLNLPPLINAVSGWFFRSIVFASFYDHTRRRVTSGMGQHSNIELALDEISRDDNRIVIEGVWRFDDAVRLIKETIESIQQPERSR